VLPMITARSAKMAMTALLYFRMISPKRRAAKKR